MRTVRHYSVILVTVLFLLLVMMTSCLDDDDDDNNEGRDVITFLESYGTSSYDDLGSDIIQLAGGEYIVVGAGEHETDRAYAASYDARLMKIDEYGQELWTHNFGLKWKNDVCVKVHYAENGEIFVLGHRWHITSSDKDSFLSKWDSQGNEIWFRTYPETIKCTDFYPTQEGGFIICGYYGTWCYLLKVDQNGLLKWSKRHHSSVYDPRAIVQIDDGGYMICGHGQQQDGYQYDISLFRTDESGELLWDKNFGGPGWDFGYCMKKTNDGGLIICGQTSPKDEDPSDALLLKVDQHGTLEWSQTYGGSESDSFSSIMQTQDGGFIITGSSKSFTVAKKNIVYLVRTDSTGNELWSQTFGDQESSGQSVKETADDGFIVVGSSFNESSWDDDILVIKTDASGEVY